LVNWLVHDLQPKVAISFTGNLNGQIAKFTLTRLLDFAVSAVTQGVDDGFIFAERQITTCSAMKPNPFSPGPCS
jgi:hypothetical protein